MGRGGQEDGLTCSRCAVAAWCPESSWRRVVFACQFGFRSHVKRGYPIRLPRIRTQCIGGSLSHRGRVARESSQFVGLLGDSHLARRSMRARLGMFTSSRHREPFGILKEGQVGGVLGTSVWRKRVCHPADLLESCAWCFRALCLSVDVRALMWLRCRRCRVSFTKNYGFVPITFLKRAYMSQSQQEYFVMASLADVTARRIQRQAVQRTANHPRVQLLASSPPYQLVSEAKACANRQNALSSNTTVLEISTRVCCPARQRRARWPTRRKKESSCGGSELLGSPLALMLKRPPWNLALAYLPRHA